MFAGRKRAEAKKKKLGKSKSTDTEEEEGDDDQDDGELYFSLSNFSQTRSSVISLPRSKSSIILGMIQARIKFRLVETESMSRPFVHLSFVIALGSINELFTSYGRCLFALKRNGFHFSL